MSPRLCSIRILLLAAGAASLGLLAGGTPTLAQPVPVHATNSPLLPATPVLRSPIALFRDLLAMSPPERLRTLANRPPEIRKRILAKVEEYESLQPDERALRLRNTELHWYLMHFMQMPAVDRAAQLANLPDADRQMVQDRLNAWDRLSPEQQQQMLDYARATESPTGITGTKGVAPFPPAANSDDQSRWLDEWNAQPAADRQQAVDRFQQFFSLSGQEQQRTLHMLSPAEVAQMQKAIESFKKLPPERQEKCLNVFPKFAGMSAAERHEFVQNAERWKEMSPNERQAWRALVSRLPRPPAPPGLGPPLPPLPGAVAMPTRHPQHPLATNSGS